MASFRILLIGTFAIVVAAVSAIAAAEIVFEESDPFLAARLPIPDGFAKTEMGQRLLAQSIKKGSLLKLDWSRARAQHVRTLSLDAYRREPLASTAVADLALVADSRGDAGRARTLMQDAEKLTRRDLIANVWLTTDYTKRQEFSPALASLDNALRTSAEARPLLIHTLVENLDDPELLAQVGQLLEASPPWANDFWHESYQIPAALPYAARLRVTVDKAGVKIPEGYDRGLLTQLTRRRLYGQAERIFDIVDPDQRKDGEIIRNADFRFVPRFKPFDWETSFDESLTADIVPSAGQLVIHSYDAGNGTAARQLLHLTTGTYAISANLAEPNQQVGGGLSATLNCAEHVGAPTAQVLRPGTGRTTQTFEIPEGDCHYFWLDLDIVPQQDRRDETVVVNSISLKRGGEHG